MSTKEIVLHTLAQGLENQESAKEVFESVLSSAKSNGSDESGCRISLLLTRWALSYGVPHDLNGFSSALVTFVDKNNARLQEFTDEATFMSQLAEEFKPVLEKYL